MLAYWLFWGILSFLTIKNMRPQSPQEMRANLPLAWKFFLVALVIFVGLRYEVGGDWLNYLTNYELIIAGENNADNSTSEIGYTWLNYLSGFFGVGIYGVNLLSAAIFAYGLIRFCRDQPYPWLAIIIAAPYMVIVIGMGYTRQSVAIGLLMYALKFLIDRSVIKYSLIIIAASLFHRTALVFLTLPILLGYVNTGRLKWISFIGASIFVFGAFVYEHVSTLYLYYVAEKMDSEGGAIRLLMNLPPIFLLFLLRTKWNLMYKDWTLWAWFAGFGLLLLGLHQFAPAASDRLGLYLIPLQMAVYSRLPSFGIGNMPIILIGLVVLYSGLVMFTWLHYSVNSYLWLPYQSLISIYITNLFSL